MTTTGQCDSLLPSSLDVEGMVTKGGSILIGTATLVTPRLTNGTYRCLANVNGALCVVEVEITFVYADRGRWDKIELD